LIFPEKFGCTVPKVFPISDVEPKTGSTVKLIRKKLRRIICLIEKGESSEIIVQIPHIMRKRVDQTWKQYRSTGIYNILARVRH